MTDSRSNHAAGERLIDLPASEIIRRVADPAVSAGGGVVAGLTLAGAAAAAELVIRLAARRKSLAARRAEIEALLDEIVHHRDFFEDAADRDLDAFTSLVAVQRRAREMRTSDPHGAESLLQDAYVRAAEVPLELSRQGLTFLNAVEQGLKFGSTFTISDLGAAASLARGGIDAALLTVHANLAYITDQRAPALQSELERLRGGAAAVSDRVLALATEVIARHGNGD